MHARPPLLPWLLPLQCTITGGSCVYVARTFGKFASWVCASNVLMELIVSSAAVAKGFAPYFCRLINQPTDAALITVPGIGGEPLVIDLVAMGLVLLVRPGRRRQQCRRGGGARAGEIPPPRPPSTPAGALFALAQHAAAQCQHTLLPCNHRPQVTILLLVGAKEASLVNIITTVVAIVCIIVTIIAGEPGSHCSSAAGPSRQLVASLQQAAAWCRRGQARHQHQQPGTMREAATARGATEHHAVSEHTGAGFTTVDSSNWVEPDGFMPFGTQGIFNAASQVFFAYIGFEMVASAAEEAKNPKRDVPIATVASVGFCGILYVLMAVVITGMVPYTMVSTGQRGRQLLPFSCWHIKC
jgi:amino acid transporter